MAGTKKTKSVYQKELKQLESRRYGFFWYSALWKVLRTVMILVCAVTLVCGLIYTGWQRFENTFFAPMDPADRTEIPFVVKSGSSLSNVSRELENSGLIANSTVFKYMADFGGMGQRIQSGRYTFTKAMSAREILDQLISGDGRPNTMQITIIPGWTVENVA